MFEEIDLKIGEEANETPNYIQFTQRYHCTYTASGGYGTGCKYCC